MCGCSQRHGKLYTLCKSTWFTYNCCIFPIFCERLLWVGKKGDSKSTWPFSLVATNLEKLHLFCIPLHILSPLLWIFGGYMDSMKHSIRKHGKVFFLIFWNFLVLSSTQHQLPPLWCIFLPIWVILYMMQGLGWI